MNMLKYFLMSFNNANVVQEMVRCWKRAQYPWPLKHLPDVALNSGCSWNLQITSQKVAKLANNTNIPLFHFHIYRFWYFLGVFKLNRNPIISKPHTVLTQGRAVRIFCQLISCVCVCVYVCKCTCVCVCVCVWTLDIVHKKRSPNSKWLIWFVSSLHNKLNRWND